MLASPECPTATEYFIPGTAPTQHCDWHAEGTVHFPQEFAEWAATDAGTIAARLDAAALRRTAAGVASPHAVAIVPHAGFTITSPENGDHYRIPPGVDARYATIALRATGAPSGHPLRWFVDGHAIAGTRWAIQPGRHRVRAQAGALSDEVEVQVE